MWSEDTAMKKLRIMSVGKIADMGGEVLRDDSRAGFSANEREDCKLVDETLEGWESDQKVRR